MRILNRPMFRYGGPIKEGVMHGMRNNYQSGQLVRPGPGRPGYQGNPRFINLGGGQPPVNVNLTNATKLQKLKNLYQNPKFSEKGAYEAIKKYGPKALKWMKGGVGSLLTRFPGLTQLGAYYTAATPTKIDKKYGITHKENIIPMFGSDEERMEGFKKKVKRNIDEEKNPNNPWRYNFWKYGAAKDHPDYDPEERSWNPWHKGAVETGGDDGTKKTDTGIGPGAQFKEDTAPIITAEMREKIAKDAQNKRLKSYLDMMGYDSAKKGALSDALIDASALVQDATTEAGSIKHADWGQLINKAIQTTSRRLDKPAQIREAVGLMTTKAEIEKDMSAEENKLAKELTAKRITKLDEELKGNSFAENKVLTAKTMPGQPGFDAAVELTKGKDFKGNLVTATDWTDTLEDMQDEPTSKGLNEKQLIKKYTNKLIEGKGYEDGDYTVGDNLVTIKDSLVISVE